MFAHSKTGSSSQSRANEVELAIVHPKWLSVAVLNTLLPVAYIVLYLSRPQPINFTNLESKGYSVPSATLPLLAFDTLRSSQF